MAWTRGLSHLYLPQFLSHLVISKGQVVGVAWRAGHGVQCFGVWRGGTADDAGLQQQGGLDGGKGVWLFKSVQVIYPLLVPHRLLVGPLVARHRLEALPYPAHVVPLQLQRSRAK